MHEQIKLSDLPRIGVAFVLVETVVNYSSKMQIKDSQQAL